MKKYLLFLALFLIPSFASAQVSGSLWKLSSGSLLPVNSTWSLTVPQLGGHGTSCVQVDNNGLFSVSGGACGGSGAAYPFPLTGNATSTLTQFNGGLTSYASSTIGNSTQAGGLTIDGGATTTGTFVVSSINGSNGTTLSLNGTANIRQTNSTAAFEVTRAGSTNGGFSIRTDGTISGSSGSVNAIGITNSISQSGTAAYVGLLIQPTETALGSGNHWLIEAGTSTSDLFTVDNLGVATVGGAGTASGKLQLANSGASTNKPYVSSDSAGDLLLHSFSNGGIAQLGAQNSVRLGLNNTSDVFTEYARVASTGNFGISSTTPYAKLSVSGFTTGTPGIVADALSGFTGNLLDLKLASTTKFAVDQAGNLTTTLSTGSVYSQSGLLLSVATTSSSQASQAVWRDANQNAFAQNFVSAATTFPSLGTTATLTAASPRTWIVTGTNTQTFKLPVGTTLTAGAQYNFNNNSTGFVTVIDNGSNVLGYVPPGGNTIFQIYDVSTTNGSWDVHARLGHSNISGTGTLSVGSTTSFVWPLAVSSSTISQLHLGSGAGETTAWNFRSEFSGQLDISTSSPTTYATSSVSAFSINTSGFPIFPALSGTGCAQWDTTGKLTNTGSACGAGGSSFGNPFNFVAGTPNYLIGTTSPLGLIMTASTTIGGGTQATGLTVAGGATTTLNNYLSLNSASNFTLIGTTTPFTSSNGGAQTLVVSNRTYAIGALPSISGISSAILGIAGAGSGGAADTGVGVWGFASDKTSTNDNGAYGVRADLDAGSSAQANTDAALIASVTGAGAANQYAIYSTGAKNYFASSVGVSTSSPYKTLSIGGDTVIAASTAGGTLGNLYVPALNIANGITSVDSTGKFQNFSGYTLTSSLLTATNASTTALTVGSFFTAPNQSTSPTNTIAGSIVINTNGTASSSIAIGDGSLTHNIFTLQSKGGIFASSTLAYMGAFGSSGSTTIGLPLDIHKQTIRSIQCYTDVGTAWVGFGTGSATTTELQCSSTPSSVSISSNNTINGGAIGYIEIGHNASAPNKITVSADIEESN